MMVKAHFVVVILGLILPQWTLAKTSPKIAIIGGGIGGTSVAYFLNELMPDSNIHIFERTRILGGRLNVTMVNGNGYETGGSIIHPRNKYAVDLAKKFGLESRSDTGEAMSIIKDGEFVFNTSKWTIITIIKTLARYGFNFQKLNGLISGFIDKFSRIYDYQKDGRTFRTPEELLEAMDPVLLNLTKSEFKTILYDNNLAENFIEEIIQAITLVNYGQDLGIHSFVGSVAASGADGDLWGVNKGNKQIPEKLAEMSGAKVHLSTEVVEIARLHDGTFQITDDGKRAVGFDQVVIALPLDASKKIKFVDFPSMPYDYPISRKYHRTVTTLIAGWTHDKYKFRSEIISCVVNNWYNSISLIHPTILLVAEKYPVYKIFSSELLTEEQLDSIFTERHHVEVHDWLAYPEYDQIPPKFPSFILAPKLYYLNAIEWAASAMEMSLISGKNIALLIAQDQNNL